MRIGVEEPTYVWCLEERTIRQGNNKDKFLAILGLAQKQKEKRVKKRGTQKVAAFFSYYGFVGYLRSYGCFFWRHLFKSTYSWKNTFYIKAMVWSWCIHLADKYSLDSLSSLAGKKQGFTVFIGMFILHNYFWSLLPYFLQVCVDNSRSIYRMGGQYP